MNKLTIVQMNDSHAYLDLHPELFWEDGRAAYRFAGGYARIATLLKEIRTENPGRVLFLDGGDTFHGTYPAVHTQGAALVPILNALQPAAMTVHWEFAYTPQGLKELAGKLNYPVLAINVHKKDDSGLFFKPYHVVEMAGLRIGVIGIASNIVDKTMPAHFSEGVTFTNGAKELPGVIQTLREVEKVNLVVLLSHLGFPQDMQLLDEVQGVDVVLSAHTHHRLQEVVRQKNALVVQSGSHGSFITQLDLSIENGKIAGFNHRLREVSSSIKPDPEVEELVQSALQPDGAELNQLVGVTRVPLDRGLNLETSMDNFLLAALLEHTGAQMAFSNGWRYGAPVLPGVLRLNDLYNIVPMNPPVSTAEITGAELSAMLEENLEHTFSRNPWNQMGGYVKRSLGIRALVKIENPPGTRLSKLFVGDKEVQPNQIYRVAFITAQGVPAQFGQNRQNHSATVIEVMQTYLHKNSPIAPQILGTFTVI